MIFNAFESRKNFPVFYFLFALIFSFSVSPTTAGPGIHGAKNVNTTNTILNEYTSLTADIVAGASTATVANSGLNSNGRFATNLVPGELVMIIQMQGATMNTANANSNLWGSITSYNNAGKYEFNEVLNVPNGTTINFVTPLVNSYTAAGKVQVIRVPRYNTFVVTGGGSVIAPAWNGSVGGVIAIESNGNTNVNGAIDVSGLGFRGGIVDSAANSNHIIYASTLKDDGAEKGEGIGGSIASYDALGGRYGRGAPANGGGGGNAHNTAGGGGSNADNGITYNGQGIPDTTTDVNWKTAWDLEGGNFHTNVSSGGGRGGYSYSMKARNPLTTPPGNTAWNGDDRFNSGGWGGRPLSNAGNRIYFGGGGGAGDNNNNTGGGGGNGGGIVVLLVGGNLSGGGVINANGSNGTNSTGNDAAGGGGGGGSVIVYSRSGSSSGLAINAKGGKGGDQARISNSSGEAEGPGGGGGGGYVSITGPSTISITVNGGGNGTTNSPTFVTFLPNGATMGSSGLNTLNPPDPYSGGGTLPVTMLSFTGEISGHTVALNWVTESEINNDYFLVEKLAANNSYAEIGTVYGHGNTSAVNEYRFIDENPAAETNYYRLVQTDFDGRTTVYGPVAVDYSKDGLVISSVSPNPFAKEIHFNIYSERSDPSASVEIWNSTGQCMRTFHVSIKEGANDIVLDELASFDAGIFFLKINCSGSGSRFIPLIHQ